MKKVTLLLTLFAMLLTGNVVTAAPPSQVPDGEAYVVQPNDWLMKIAEKFYGDAAAYRVIVEATNAKAAEDASFAVIDNPSLIRVGQKLWIPAQPVAVEGALTLEALQNASYQGIYDEPVQLTDGRYEGEPFVPGGASRPTVTLHPEVYAFGDLNGDGVDDAAVILIENSGGSGNFRYLAAVINEGGAPVNVATQFVGDREQVQAISIDGNEITLDMVAHGPDDPMCCPTQQVRKTYALEGDQLVEIASETAMAFQSELIGIYKGWSRAASSPGIDSTLYLNADHSVKLVSDYLNGEPPIVEVGTWRGYGDDTIVLTILGQEDRPYEAAELVTLTREGDILATAADEDAYGELGRRWIRFDTVARGPASLPYDAAAATRAVEANGFVGIYKAMLPAATCCGRDITLYLVFDNTAQLKTDYLNNEPPIVEVGTWEADSDGRLTLTLTGREDRVYEAPNIITFELVDGMLAAVEYDESIYGAAGLQLYYFDGLLAASLPSVPAPTAIDLESTLWTLVSYGDPSDPQAVLEGSQITAEFDSAEGRVHGSAGCNSYFGSYEVDGDAITFGLLGSTLMACLEPEGIMQQEQAYLAVLVSVATYRIEGDKLELIDADGTRVAQFIALPPASLAGTEWTLTAYNNGQGAVVSVLIGTEITAAFGDDGRLTGSAGCNTYGASYEVDGDHIALGPAVTTRMWCPEPEGIMDQESAFLAALESAVTYHIQGDRLEMRTADDALALQFTAKPAGVAAGEAYIVQPGDWLMKIAKKFYGDADAYRAIVEATNAKAAEDASFAVIDNPNLISVGQKLWIPAQAGTAEGELTLEALQNAVYQGIYDEPVQLTDGRYEGEPFVPGGASRPTVTLHPEVYAFGDLNGDGVDDAAVILIESSGGSGNFLYLAAVINEGGTPMNVATQFVGDREQVQAITIEDGEITLNMVAHGPDDPMCCPTQEITKRYQLQGDQLIEL